MKRTLISTVLMSSVGTCSAADFQPPFRLQGDGIARPGRKPRLCGPCWADIDGDGKKDLLVGQFNQGKIRVFKNLGDGKLAAGDVAEGRRDGGRSPGRVVMHQLHSTVCGPRRRRPSRHPLRLLLPHGTRHGGAVPGPVRQGGRDVPQGRSPEGHRRRAAHHPRQGQAR